MGRPIPYCGTQRRQRLHSLVSRWVTVRRRQSEWEVSETLPRVKGLRSMYHSVNTFYVLVNTGGELEDLKPTEKALRLEEVTIFRLVFSFRKKNKRMLSMDLATSLRVLCYLAGRITSLVETVVNAISKF